MGPSAAKRLDFNKEKQRQLCASRLPSKAHTLHATSRLFTQATLERIPRSREVGQSYVSSVFSTLRATAACWPLLRKHRPEMVRTVAKSKWRGGPCILPGSGSSRCHPPWMLSLFLFSNPCSQLIVNGPGSCIPLCLVATLAGILGLQRTAIVYIESICRVSTLSLSAKLLRFGIAGAGSWMSGRSGRAALFIFPTLYSII